MGRRTGPSTWIWTPPRLKKLQPTAVE
jgi:hypothetical protein